MLRLQTRNLFRSSGVVASSVVSSTTKEVLPVSSACSSFSSSSYSFLLPSTITVATRFASSSPPSSAKPQQQAPQQQQQQQNQGGVLGGGVDPKLSRHGGTAGAGDPMAAARAAAGLGGGRRGGEEGGEGGFASAAAGAAGASRHGFSGRNPGSVGIRRAHVTSMPPWERLGRISRREYAEELRRPHRPPFPKLPAGWSIQHEPGTSFFTMQKKTSSADAHSFSGADEELRVFCAGCPKEPERTFRLDDGERDEPEHLNYTVFISKPSCARDESAALGARGGVEVGLTTIDSELVLDTIAIHDTAEHFETAWKARLVGPGPAYLRDRYYRGPYIGELDEDFVDEILNFLDDRGINNAFAEFMQSQFHWYEQWEYENWLQSCQAISTPTEKPASTSSSSSSSGETSESESGEESASTTSTAGDSNKNQEGEQKQEKEEAKQEEEVEKKSSK